MDCIQRNVKPKIHHPHQLLFEVLRRRELAEYLTTSEVFDLQKAYPSLRLCMLQDIVPPSTELSVGWHDRELHYRHQSYQWFSFHVPVAASNIKSIVFTGSWKDQGWGYRKGKLSIVSSAAGFPEGILSSVKVAPHEWESFNLEFTPTLFHHYHDNCIKEGSDQYELWYRVGGGGGHELFIKDLSITIIKYCVDFNS